MAKHMLSFVNRKNVTQFTTLVLLFSLTGLGGCLKTRAQMRGEGDSSGSGSGNNSGYAQNDDRIAAPSKEVVPDSRYVVEELKAEVVRLTGRIEDLEREKKSSDAQGSGARADEVHKLEQRLSEMEANQAALVESLKKLQEGPPPNAEPKDLLERARGQVESKNYEGAIETLNAFLKKPKKLPAKDVEEAHLLRGDSYFALKQYKKAIVDYSEFPEKYAKSANQPHALLKLGQSFDALGMKEDAKLFYRDLVEKFPKSSEAKKARSKAK